MNQLKSAFQTTRAERWAYPLFSFGQVMVYGLVTGYLALYYTDYILIPAFAVSAIFMVAKVWDAVNDPLFGIIVDRMSFKSGKFRPWLKISTFAIPAATVLLFLLSPEMKLGWRVAIAAISYIVWDAAYTISDVPVFSLLTAMTGNIQERSTILSRGSLGGIVCMILLVVVLAPQFEHIGFLPIALIVALASLLGMLPLTLIAKERNRQAEPEGEKATVRDILRYLKGNKYLAIFMAAALTSGILNISGALGTYIAIYFFGGLEFTAKLTMIGVVPLVVVYLLFPKITARVDRMKLYRICVFITIGLATIQYLAGPGNWYVYGALSILRVLIGAPQGLLAFTFTMDCVEYGHFKTGQRREGITMSVQTFINKLNSALSSSLMLLVLGFAGYNGALEMQSEATLRAMWATNYFIPLAGVLLSLPLLFAYKLKSRDVQVMADVNAGKLERTEGEAMMLRQY